MQETKLYEIWQILTRIEQRELGKWLAYDNVRDDVLRLYALFCEMRDKNVEYSKTEVFERLYGAADYNDNRLRHAQSFLVKSIEDFLVFRSICDDKPAAQERLTAEYNRRTAEKPFLQAFKTWQTTLKTAPQHAATLRAQQEAERVWQAYKMPLDPNDDNLQDLLDAEERAFAAHKLRTVCTAISYQNVRKKDYDFGILDDLLQHIETRNWQETTLAIGAYYYIYKMLTTEEGLPFFNILIEKLPDYQAIFMAKEYKDIYVNVANFAIQTINRYGISKHGDAFLRQLFGLYQQGVKQGYLLNQQQISPITYKNIVAIGLRLSEYEYVQRFLEDYRTALPKADRRTYYQYNLARYYFTVKNYTEAMPILNKLEGNQVFLLLDAKLMLLKIYYELAEYDVLEAHLRAFGQFLHRKRNVLSYHQTNYKNIIALTKNLMEIDVRNETQLETLRQEIENTNPLTEREWLLAQCGKCYGAMQL